MPIDAHAHYVPPALIEALQSRARDFGLTLEKHPPGCACAIHFDYGLKLRPFFPKLIEPLEKRLAGMAEQGVDRQVLSIWGDMFGYGLPRELAIRWHRFMNERMADLCERESERFSLLASVPLPDAEAAAAELAYAVEELGAVGAVVAANAVGKSLGELDLDAFWRMAQELDVGVFIHPVEPVPSPRAARWGLMQSAQYTYDTTLCVGSLVYSGVLDRFPSLRLMLSHGGGTVPYLAGRFDCMHERMDRAAQGDVAERRPSDYLTRFYYDTILHDPTILAWLATRVSTERIVLGSDYSFPPADLDPVGTVRRAGFSGTEMRAILEENPRRLFPRLP